MDWLRWSLVAAAGAHIFEEFEWPGAFVEWYGRYMPANAARLTRGFLIGINALLLAGCFQAGELGSSDQGTALWLTMAAFLFFNGWFHIAGAIRMRGYSPGLITSICLYIPLSIFGYFKLLGAGRASTGTALIAILIGTAHEAYVYTRNYLGARHVPQH
jgi:hypothetical protein